MRLDDWIAFPSAGCDELPTTIVTAVSGEDEELVVVWVSL